MNWNQYPEIATFNEAINAHIKQRELQIAAKNEKEQEFRMEQRQRIIKMLGNLRDRLNKQIAKNTQDLTLLEVLRGLRSIEAINKQGKVEVTPEAMRRMPIGLIEKFSDLANDLVENQKVIDKITVDEFAYDKPVADKPVADKPVSDKPVTDNPVFDNPVSDKPVSDQVTADDILRTQRMACNSQIQSEVANMLSNPKPEFEPRYMDLNFDFTRRTANAMGEGHVKYELSYSIHQKAYKRQCMEFAYNRLNNLFKHVMFLIAWYNYKLEVESTTDLHTFCNVLPEGFTEEDHLGHAAANLNMLAYYEQVGVLPNSEHNTPAKD